MTDLHGVIEGATTSTVGGPGATPRPPIVMIAMFASSGASTLSRPERAPFERRSAPRGREAPVA